MSGRDGEHTSPLAYFHAQPGGNIMEEARRERLTLQRQQPHVSCSGWKWHCLCPHHANLGGGLLDRFEEAVRSEDQGLTLLLRTEINNIQKTLGRTTLGPA